jgi:hypothetical protein
MLSFIISLNFPGSSIDATQVRFRERGEVLTVTGLSFQDKSQ